MNANRPRQQAGFSMIEVLITVVVLSIGLLGLAGLQIDSLQAEAGAQQRAGIAFLGQDMAERIRSNPVGKEAGAYDNLTTPGTDQGCISSGCTPTELAQHDLYEWGQLLAAQLPSGVGRVVNNGGVFTVTVMWDDKRTGATGTGCDSSDPDDLTCFAVSFAP